MMKRIFGTVSKYQTNDLVVALTFDDGPHPSSTPFLLDILEKYNAKATFFLVGTRASKYANLVRNIADGGHAIGNHSWSHPSFPTISFRQRYRQIKACEQVISPYGEKIFRPPFGHQSFLTFVHTALLGYKIIGWSHSADDWKADNTDQIVEKLEKNIKPGSIVLLHDALYSVDKNVLPFKQKTGQILKDLLEHLNGKFQFVTLPQLMNAGTEIKVKWIKKGEVSWLNNIIVMDNN